jgi:hypothetical protein
MADGARTRGDLRGTSNANAAAKDGCVQTRARVAWLVATFARQRSIVV